MNIGKSIDVALAINGMSGKDLAVAMSKSEVTISKWRNNTASPTMADLEKMATVVFDQLVSRFIEWGEQNGKSNFQRFRA